MLCALVAPWWNIPRDQADSAGMLAHLHALFVGADLLYDDEYAALGMSPLFAFVTDEGVVSNHWPAGASWLQAPGYGLGLLAAKVAASLGVGRGEPMGVIVVLSVRAWAGLVLVAMAMGMARLCTAAAPDPDDDGARWTGRAIAAAAVVGTPLYYYAAEAPLRPHLWGAALTLLAVGLWWQPPPNVSPRARTVALAALVGLATYVRPQLAPLTLLVAHDAWPGPERWRRIALGAAVFVPWPLLHLRTQLWMYGDGLGDYAGEVTQHLSYFLLSSHHGVVPWCPILVVALLAMGRSAARRERGAWVLLALILMQLWLDGGMRAIEPRSVLGTRTWSGGVSFGPRKLVDVLPLMLPAAASLGHALRRRGRGRVALSVAGLICLPTLLLHASAWLSPDATTGGIMAWPEYRAALGRPFDPSAWSTAISQRSMPFVAIAAVMLLVAVPLWLAGALTLRRVRALEPSAGPVARSVPIALFVLVVMHGWLAWLMIRSDAAMRRDPQRMLDVAARMTPAHYATVRRIPAHHRVLRQRLGDGAAP